MSKPDYFHEEETTPDCLESAELREVLFLLLERMKLKIIKETSIYHGDPKKISFRLEEKK